MSLKKQRARERASDLEELPEHTPETIKQIKTFEFLYSSRHFVQQLEQCEMSPLLIPIYERQYKKVIEDATRLLYIKFRSKP